MLVQSDWTCRCPSRNQGLVYVAPLGLGPVTVWISTLHFGVDNSRPPEGGFDLYLEEQPGIARWMRAVVCYRKRYPRRRARFEDLWCLLSVYTPPCRAKNARRGWGTRRRFRGGRGDILSEASGMRELPLSGDCSGCSVLGSPSTSLVSTLAGLER